MGACPSSRIHSVGACVCGCGEDTDAGPRGSVLKTNLHLEDAEKARRTLCLIQVQIGFPVVSESTFEPRGLPRLEFNS